MELACLAFPFFLVLEMKMMFPYKRHPSNYYYACWQNIKARCYKTDHYAYKDYGARGITLHKSWHTDYDLGYYSDAFSHFVTGILEEIGERPPGLSLDRVDNDGNYEPGNLRWATAKQQANNKTRKENENA